MVNPGAFRGSRKEFLMGEKAAYSVAMAGGYAGDALALIQRRYFKRYPVNLPHSEEPTPEHLAKVNDDEPDPEPEEPDPEKMTPAECKATIEALEERQKILQFRKAQIRRWMAYQYMKDQDLDPKDSGANNPYNALLFQLTGKETGRPRKKTAVNVWRKTQRAVIEGKVKARSAGTGTGRDKLAALRDKVAREMFVALSEKDKEHWKQQASLESEAAIKAWKSDMESEPSEDPKDRQRCIQGLTRVALPFLDLICKATGWKATLIAGGPEPAFDGRLNVISIHSGVTSGDVKMNFGRAERVRFKKDIIPAFGSFLQKCYTPDECRARALHSEDGFLPLDPEDLEADGATIHSVGFDTDSPGASHAALDLSTRPSPAPQPGLGGDKPPASDGHEVPVTASSLADPSPTPQPGLGGGRPAPSDEREAPVAALPTAPPPIIPRGPTPAHPLAHSRGPTPVPSPAPSRGPTPAPASVCSRGPSPAPSPRSRGPTPVAFPIVASNQAPTAATASSAPVPAPAVTGSQPAPVAGSAAQGTCQDPPYQTLPVGKGGEKDGAGLAPTRSALAAAGAGAEDESSAAGAVDGRGRKRGNQASVARDDPMDVRPAKRVRTRVRAGPTSIPPLPPSCSTTPSPTVTPPSTSSPTTAVSPTQPTTVVVPSDSPKWFEDALHMLQSNSLGMPWSSLLQAWTDFEALHNFKEQGRLKATNRPPCVGEWIGRARSSTWDPAIKDTLHFERTYTKWWTSLQPDWRIAEDGEVDYTLVEGNWDGLRKPGLNGLLSAVAALFYWGLAVKDDVKGRAGWLVAVSDCRVACEHLISSAA